MIAITFALPTESADLLRRLESRRVNSSNNLKVLSGTIGGRDVAVFHTGVGRSNCQRNIEAFLQTTRPELLISSGFAGSLKEELEPGDLIVAENFSRAELVHKLMKGGVPSTGSGQAPATPTRHRFRIAGSRPSHEATARQARELAPPSIRAVHLVTLDSMVHSPQERSTVAQRHNADAADMETELIAQCCAGSGIPMLSLRVISDSPTATFPMPPHILFDVAKQRTNFRRLIRYALTHPAAAVSLFGFARRISRARDILTSAIIDVIMTTTPR